MPKGSWCGHSGLVMSFIKRSTGSVTLGELYRPLSGCMFPNITSHSFIIGLCDLGSGRPLLGKM